MANRGIGWTKETVEAMNLIPVVFVDDEIVTCQWKVFFDSTNTPDRSAKASEKMTKEEVKLLEAMAKTLGYDKNITWETIGDSYMPEGMANQLIQDEQMRTVTVMFMQQMQSNMESKSESITQ